MRGWFPFTGMYPWRRDPTFGYGGNPLSLILPQPNSRIIRVIVQVGRRFRGVAVKQVSSHNTSSPAFKLPRPNPPNLSSSFGRVKIGG